MLLDFRTYWVPSWTVDCVETNHRCWWSWNGTTYLRRNRCNGPGLQKATWRRVLKRAFFGQILEIFMGRSKFEKTGDSNLKYRDLQIFEFSKKNRDCRFWSFQELFCQRMLTILRLLSLLSFMIFKKIWDLSENFEKFLLGRSY